MISRTTQSTTTLCVRSVFHHHHHHLMRMKKRVLERRDSCSPINIDDQMRTWSMRFLEVYGVEQAPGSIWLGVLEKEQ